MRAKKNFQTLECYTGLKDLKVPAGSCVLLECMSNLVANEMYQDQGAKEKTVEEVMEGIRSLAGQARELVIVTNEIFSDGIQYSPETIQYQAFLGQIDQAIAKMAVNVTEVVYGIPLCHTKERKERQKIDTNSGAVLEEI